MAALRTRMVGTTVGTPLSSFLRSRGCIPNLSHSSPFAKSPAVFVTSPVNLPDQHSSEVNKSIERTFRIERRATQFEPR
jgi:hypothetical protein